jgi:hypothetical protein
MSTYIKIGSTVQLLYWRDQKVHDFVVTDIYFKHYVDDYKTVIKTAYYSKNSDCLFIETYDVNDFFEAMNKAKEIEK